MAESIYLQLPRTAGQAHWLLVDALGNRIGHVQQGSLADAAAQAHGRRLTAFVPGEEVMLFLAEIPSRSLQKVQQAAPFMLEDRLASDVENLHFAASLGDAGSHLVAVTEQSHMRRWLGEMTQVGMEPVQVTADTTALAAPEGAVVIALDGAHVMARFPDGSGFTAERELAVTLLKRRLMPTEDSTARVVIHASETDDGPGFAAKLDGLGVDFSFAPLSDGVLPLLAAGSRQQRGLNLLQGGFQPRSDFQEHWRVWRTATVLAAACLILLLIQQGMSYLHLRREAAGLDAQVTQLFNQAMPGSRSIPGSEKQRMQALLSQLQGGSSAGALLPLLDTLGNAASQYPSIQIIALNYQDGSLQAQLQAGDIGALDALKSAIGGKGGITASLDSVSASGGQVTGRITLSGGGA